MNPDLEFLHLGSTGVTDTGITQLQPLKSLADLRVTRTAVTPKGAEQFRQKRPGVAVQLAYVPGQ